MSIDLKDIERRMSATVDGLKHEFGGLRTGRASASLLEPIMVDAYGSKVPITQVGTISVADARLLTVQIWDSGLVRHVEKAIRDANLGLNPVADGGTVRVSIPDLTEERRNELVKIASKYAEQAKVAIRNIRRDGMDALKKAEKDGDISQDEQKTLSEKVQVSTDKFVKNVDEALAHKEKDIKQV